MFFIAGSLLAHSLDKKPALEVLRSRLKRLLIPFWVYGGVVLTALAMVYRMSASADTRMSFTQVLHLNLVGHGKIALDDKLPTIKAVPELPYAGKVTVRQILNHTAGIKPYDKSAAYAGAKGSPLTPQSALKLIVSEPLEWAPGSQVGYSNSGFLTLGLLAEQLSGKK